MATIHHQCAHFKQRPLAWIVQIGKTDKAIHQGQNIGLVQDQPFHFPDIVQYKGGLMTLFDQRLNPIDKDRIFNILFHFFGRELFHGPIRF
nr:hypothetical protein [uncultured bacterium]